MTVRTLNLGDAGNFDTSLESDFLPQMFNNLKRHWLAIVCYGFFLFALIVFAVQLWPKTYRGIASVEIQSQTVQLGNRELLPETAQFTDETAGTELGYLKSRELAIAVINQLGLISNPEFNPNLKPTTVERIVAWARQTPLSSIPERWIAAVASKLPESWFADAGPSEMPGNTEKQLYDTIQSFHSHVVPSPVSHSKIMEIAATSRDPVLAAKLANATAAEYMAIHKRLKEQLFTKAYEDATRRLPELEASMKTAQAAVDDYRQTHNLVLGQVGPIMRERLTEATKQLADARTRLATLEASAQVASGKGVDPLTVPEVLASLTVQSLRREESQAMGEFGQANVFQQPRLQQRVNEIRASIAAESRRIVASLPKAVAAARANIAAQEKAIVELQKEVGASERERSALTALENEANLRASQYASIQKGAIEAQPNPNSAELNVRLVSGAGVPFKAYSPNNLYAVPVAFIFSFGLMILLTLFTERHGSGLRSSLAISNAFNLDVVGRIPLRTKRAHDALYLAAIEEMLSRVFPPWEANVRKTVLFTSPYPEAGKTTLALAMGEAAARRNLSVVVVDADMRRVSRGSGAPSIGLGDVLNGQSVVSDVTVRRNGMALVPAGTPRSDPTALFAQPHLQTMLTQLQEEYALVLIDAPPACLGGDVLTLSHYVDEVLVVVPEGTLEVQMMMTLDRLRHMNREKIMIALNKITLGGSAVEEITYSKPMQKYYGERKPKMITAH